MEKLLEQISAYELLNNLLPGVVQYSLMCWNTGSQPVTGNVILDIFLCYFIGLVANRFGSLVIEPLCRRLRIILHVDYDVYVMASRKDQKIETLSSINNMYRTFISSFILYGVWLVQKFLVKRWPEWSVFIKIVDFGILISLFILSYRKQTEYIVRRIEMQNQSNDGGPEDS